MLHLSERLSELKLPLEHSPADLEAAILRRLQLPAASLVGYTLVKRSIDARRRGAIQVVYCLDLELTLQEKEQRRLRRRFAGDPHLRPTPDHSYHFVAQAPAASLPPVVVGAGPCGYFCALVLAQMGYRPLLLERGKPVKQRTADTFGFWRGERPFQSESNAQFGEGGAGTFSDGKLYSQISEPAAYVRKVLEELVAAGAPAEILTRHRPHIGTFKLATVVRGLRARIEALGGEVRFEQRVEGLDLDPADHSVRGVLLADGQRIGARQVVLAVGHSARDTFVWLNRLGVAMEPKPFAVGLRIEHPQSLIDAALWGEAAGHPQLGPAEYKLVHHGSDGRAVYSFCMCPGGLVVGAASEADGVVTNGMSQHSRNERNANSGIVVNVTLEDLRPWQQRPGDPLAGMAFQRHWERQAFSAGGGDHRAPAQFLGDFMAGRESSEAEQRDAEGSASEDLIKIVRASYLPGVRLGRLDHCLPAPMIAAIREALPHFAKKIRGFGMAGALLTGVETRTSSPLRISRQGETLQSLNTPGLFPAGEGAGYAGGILSAAIDGIKVAEALALNPPLLLSPEERDGFACDPA
ncbi:MAG: FAD-dependent oxidoreductase [Cyanobacteria bacterium]|nr:FAD-dependent oxidoreductase [Cyanobacteriota bacterium]